ncbi:MAG: hypothetical protein CMJ24_11860 [Phycisphaerae bacterium]|nr:hypothetical protein [Phycisphaerae bacterium]
MQWLWIDRLMDFKAESQLSAVMDITSALERQNTHMNAMNDSGRMDVLPMPLVIEGMAQTAGILVGSVNHFKEKVILAKITRAGMDVDMHAGDQIRFKAHLDRIDDKGASTTGLVQRSTDGGEHWNDVGTIQLMFSHVDNNMSGLEFPEHNFVFSGSFRKLLADAGLEYLYDD